MISIIVTALILIILIVLISMYNSLVRSRNNVRNAWSQIDVQLKRRHDLIPNLVETAKGYVKHERETFESVTKARTQAMSAATVGEKSRAETELTQAMGRLSVVLENYPELKANQNFLALQEELTATENRIGFARQNYNDQVLGYNNRTGTFPSNLIAGAFNFKTEEYFEVENTVERQAPRVSFS